MTNNALVMNLINLVRILFAWLFLFVLLPYLMRFFIRQETEQDNPDIKLLDRFFINMACMISLMVSACYILIALKLYEVISIFGFLIFCFVLLSWRYYGSNAQRKAANDQKVAFALDMLEEPKLFRILLSKKLKEKLNQLQKILFYRIQGKIWIPLGLIVVLGYAAFVRMWDPLNHFAPAMSDAYTTMAWVKYIDWRMLFHDGLYPHGFHIFLSLLHKFSGANVLFVINMVGPLNGVMIVLSIYYAGWRLTKTHAGGLIPAALYGVFLPYLTSDSMRQTATNSQEFALIWLLPVLVWAWEYLVTGRRIWLVACVMGVLLIVLTHPMVTLFAIVGLAVLCFTSWFGVGLRDYINRSINLVKGVAAAGIIGCLPLLIGWLAGKKAHSASLQFAESTKVFSLPHLDMFSQYLIAAAVVGIVLAFLFTRFRREQFKAPIVTLVMLGAATALYLGPYWGLNSTSILARSGEFLALIVCLSCTWAAAVWEEMWCKLRRLWHRIRKSDTDILNVKSFSWLEGISALLLLALVWNFGFKYYPPKVLHPYRLQYESVVEQYLSIAENFRPTEWMIVAPSEMYALILGVGWHLPTSDYLKQGYTINHGELYKGNKYVETQDLFVFVEKEPFVCPQDIKSLTGLYLERAKNERKMSAIMAGLSAKKNRTIFYEDNQLVVYHYNNPIDPIERFNKLWGIN